MPRADRADLRGGETVLLVDDEPSIRRAGSRMLGRFGYRVAHRRGRAATAVACLERQRAGIDVVVTDMVMPQHGRARPHRHHPPPLAGLPVLLSTGYDAGRLGQGDLTLFNGLVPKPYTPEEMLRAVRKALDGRELTGGRHRHDAHAHRGCRGAPHGRVRGRRSHPDRHPA